MHTPQPSRLSSGMGTAGREMANDGEVSASSSIYKPNEIPVPGVSEQDVKQQQEVKFVSDTIILPTKIEHRRESGIIGLIPERPGLITGDMESQGHPECKRSRARQARGVLRYTAGRRCT